MDVPEIAAEEEPQLDEHADTAPLAAEYAKRLAELDGRERMLAAAGAELAFRERRLLEREAALETLAQRMTAELAAKLLEAGPGAGDELARVRARRHGSVA